MKTLTFISAVISIIMQCGCTFQAVKAEDRLAELRNQIDQTDSDLIQLISTRLQIAKEIGVIKKDLGKSVIDPTREALVIERFTGLAEQKNVPKETANVVIKSLIAASRAQQSP